MDHLVSSKQKQTFDQRLQYNCKQYDKIRVLGKGSFGTAVVHRRRADCSLVVLKEIDLQQFKGDKEKCSALNEAKIMSSLDHINIIKYYNAYLTDTKLLIEMEYASMGTLANYLSLQTNPLNEHEILIIFKQIVSGLSYLHEKNIVHLDLKMANIFITIDGLVKIGDFGIAQYMQQKSSSQNSSSSMIDQQNQHHHNRHHHHHHHDHLQPLEQRRNSAAVTIGSGAGAGAGADASNNGNRRSLHQQSNGAGGSHFAGTLAYSSPERCLGQATNFKSDIWSLGCILYELITSRPLFSGESLPEIVMRVTQIQYAPIKRDSSSISLELRRTFEKTIKQKPNERPTAKELLIIIDELLNLRATSNHQQSHQQRHSNKIRKRRNNGLDLSTDVANYIINNDNNNNNNNNNNSKKRDLAQLRYPHSLIYQVRLDSRHIQIDRVNLPLTKRIKELCKGKSHYLVLTYDNIVFGWGSRSHGELGSCGLGLSARIRANQSSSTSSSSTRTNDQREIKQSNNEAEAKPGQVVLESKSSRDNNLISHRTTLTSATATATSPKAFIINELNHRKIIQVAAGNDFSVFLSKTGIVMTCGDGSSGCLGRGNLRSSFTPCMVESLLNTDIVSIASGPEHVVAVCGNGKAFAWGNSGKGRLGIGIGISNRDLITTNCSAASNDLHQSSGLPGSTKLVAPECSTMQVDSANSSIFGKFLSVPHPVKFSDDSVFIKNAFCGDKCTIFIDSKNRCWACGENKSNKLGLDIKRRFKKTLIVDESWYPIEITSLSKNQIISCNIGKNHSTFIASDGRLFVYGRDIDQAYRLRRNIINGIDSHRKISFELHTTGNRNRYLAINSSNRQKRSTMRLYRRNSNLASPIDLRKLAKSTVINNQSSEFKQSKDNLLLDKQRKTKKANEDYPKYLLTKLQRQQVDTFLKKSRATKKMSFECVIASSCTRKFTLALTNDNRIYFWGTRSYIRDESKSIKVRSQHDERQQQHLEPQLVPADLDECFVKIGATNRSLMTTIQALGSDQPIVHGRDPRLTANTLADLWILDYKPSSSISSLSSSSSRRGSSTSMADGDDFSTSSSSSGSQESCCSSCCSSELVYNSNYDFKHDAILDPQPIVSLYVPSMFNHSGCSLQLVDLFCHDEDKFYLVLDTTVKMHHLTAANGQHQQQQQQLLQNKQNPTPLEQVNSQSKRLSPSDANASPNDSNGKQQSRRQSIGDVSEATKLSGNLNNNKQVETLDAIMESSKQTTQDGSVHNSIVSHQHKVIADRESALNDQENSSSVATTDDNNNIVDDNLKTPEPLLGQSPNPSDSQLLMVVGASLDEPRSMSTFVANSMGNQIIVGPSMRLATVGTDQMEPLNFSDSLEDQKSSSEVNDCEQHHRDDERHRDELSSSSNTTLEGGDGSDSVKLVDQVSNAIRQQRRKSRQMRDLSESNTSFTCNETSPMPSWVRNEYNLQQQQQQGQQQQHQHQSSPSTSSSQQAGDEFMFAVDSSSASERTCITRHPYYIGTSKSEVCPTATENNENENKHADYDNDNGFELMVDAGDRCDVEYDITPKNSPTSVSNMQPDDAVAVRCCENELGSIFAASGFLSQSQPNIRGNQDNGTNSAENDDHQLQLKVMNDNNNDSVLTTRRSFATLSQQASTNQAETNSIDNRQSSINDLSVDHCDVFWTDTANRTNNAAAYRSRTNLQTSIVNISGLSTRSSSNNPLIGSPNLIRRSELPLGGLDGRYTGMSEVIDSNHRRHLDEGGAHLWPSNSNLHDGLQRSSSSINEVTRFQQQQQQTTSRLGSTSMFSKSVQQLNVNQKFRGQNNKMTNGSVNSVASSIRKSLLKLFC